jgi:ketosteroid isomerase-like protein
MSDHPNARRLREGYVAFAKGDFAALDDLFDENIHWTQPGRSQLAGTYDGRQAVYEMFGRLMQVTEGSFATEPMTVLADDETGVAVCRTTGHRGDVRVDITDAHIARFREGRVTEFIPASSDQYALDELIG